MKNNRKVAIYITVMAVIGVFLIFLGNQFFKNDEADQNDHTAYAADIEKKLEEFLLKIEGIYAAKVIVTLTIDKTVDNGYFNAGLANSEAYYPTVQGVAIACTNGDDYKVKMKLTSLVSAYLGISSNRIEIIDIK